MPDKLNIQNQSGISTSIVVRFKSDTLAAFTFRAQRVNANYIWNHGSYKGTAVKIPTLATIIFITKGDMSYLCFDRRVPNVSLVPRLSYTEGNALRKPHHDRRCHFEFGIGVRFSDLISRICIDISESRNANSPIVNHRLNMLGFFATYVFFMVVSI